MADILLEEGPNRGLVLSVRRGEDTGKSVVWSVEGLEDYWDPLGRGIPGTEEQGIFLLGSPIESHQYTRNRIKERIGKIKDLTDRLHTMKDAHLEFVLLRNCLHLPFEVHTEDSGAHRLHRAMEGI